MYRAKSSARIRSLKGPADMNLSVVGSEKGSDRQEHILRYLAKWLDPWTDERSAAADYRLLMMDMAGSHVQQSVVDFAWGRGYMVLYHYGGITGVLQVKGSTSRRSSRASTRSRSSAPAASPDRRRRCWTTLRPLGGGCGMTKRSKATSTPS